MANPLKAAIRALLVSATVAAGLMLATAAQARYSAVDDGTTIPFSGYCETRDGFRGEIIGDQCDETYKLPYLVDFGSGKTDKISLRDDGTLQFVGEKICEPLVSGCDDPTQLLKRLNICDPLFACSIDIVRQTDYQIAEINFHGAGLLSSTVVASWFLCPEPTSCFQGTRTVSLTPRCASIALLNTCDGFAVEYFGFDKQKAFIPARFSALSAPEPGAWTLLVLGFGGIGATLRSRRRARLQSA